MLKGADTVATWGRLWSGGIQTAKGPYVRPAHARHSVSQAQVLHNACVASAAVAPFSKHAVIDD